MGMLLGVVRRFMGLSTDTKPTSVPFGSEFFEENTGVTYVYSSAGWVLRYGKSVLTPEGWVAILLKNSTGAATVKGSVVHSGSGNAEVILITDGIPDAIGVFYDSGVADGQLALVVVCGVADVYYVGNTTAGHLARTFIGSEAGYVTGRALSEAVPTSPFASDKHFCEIGHVIESRVGAGLARTVLHFN